MLDRRLLCVALLCVACSKPKPKGPVCDGPTTPPAADEPCPPGTTVSPVTCPLDTCRYCEKPDRARHGPFTTWSVAERWIEIIPDKHGRWGSHMTPVRGDRSEAGWFKNGVRHGLFVRWYREGAKALEATYCNGVLQSGVRRWTERGD